MPSTYAHYRMGQEIREALDGKEREIVDTFPELFQIGLHGPDILFYYKPLSKNEVNQTGYGMHDRPGADFFEKAARVIRGQKDQTAYLSYIYGFLCHFALDVKCHGYIAEKMEASGVTHAEVEVEFDRELMVRDGLDPVRHRLTNHIVPSMENASVIQAFFEKLTTEQIYKALKGTIQFNNILLAPSKAKRFVIYTGMKIAGTYENMRGLMVNFEKNPVCADSSEHLIELYGEGKQLAEQLIRTFAGYVADENPLQEVYRYTFGSELLSEN